MNLYICRYPSDQVLLHINFKSRQVAGRASTLCHMPYDSGPRLSIEIGFGAVICPIALDLASRLRWAPTLPRVPRLQTLPPD
jgi:hypothetical protein